MGRHNGKARRRGLTVGNALANAIKPVHIKYY